jgi:hypothetical protein
MGGERMKPGWSMWALAVVLGLATLSSAHAASATDCRRQLLRYCVSSYAGWDVPPALTACIDAMAPPTGKTPAWYDLRGEIAKGTIPPLARYRRCLAGQPAAQPLPTLSPPHAVSGS